MFERTTFKTVALPAAGQSAVTAALRFTPGPLKVEINLSLEALPNLVNTKKATVTLEHADTEGGSYSTLETVGNMVVTGPSSGGSAAKTWRLYIPPVRKLWVRAAVAVEASGGDNTAKKLTFAVVL